ncbi:MAG TPA: lipopolysaccharide heptosyltransferase II [Thermoguttaceae bacterium]|nr:lipopolysaccharide heptosyltransferase II [Thermoguttaceae bacterium]
MKVAIFLPNWLGDLVMATPVLRAMRRHLGPDALIVGIMRPYLADLLAGTDWLSEQWHYDPRSKDSGLRPWALTRRLRRRRFDMALMLPHSLRPAVVAYLGGVKERIGYVRNLRGPLLTRKLHYRRAGRRLVPVPVVDTFLALAKAAGCGPESPRLELATTEAEEREADGVFERLGLRDDGRVLAFNCSGAYGGTKLWPVEYFGKLARRVVEQTDHDVLVMCGPDEQETAREIVRLADRPRVFSMADQPLDLGTAKACMRQSRLMVSTDSGPRHVAAAFGKPLVTLFGPLLPIWSENPTQRAVNLCLDLDCIGCRRRVCPLGHHKCMRGLSVEMVYAEVVKLLEEGTSVKAA